MDLSSLTLQYVGGSGGQGWPTSFWGPLDNHLVRLFCAPSRPWFICCLCTKIAASLKDVLSLAGEAEVCKDLRQNVNSVAQCVSVF